MKRDTLLDFLTQRADPENHRHFQEVLVAASGDSKLAEKWAKYGWKAQGGNPLAPETVRGLETLFKVLYRDGSPDAVKKFVGDKGKEPLTRYLPETKGEKFGKWLKEMKDTKGKSLWDDFKKLARGKDPLEMSASELQQLFKVYRDPNSKTSHWEVLIGPEHVDGKKTVQNIGGAVARFYRDNKGLFDSPEDIDYDTSTKILKFTGPESKFPDLLEEIGVRIEIQQNILKQKRDLKGIWSIPLLEGKASNIFKYWSTEEPFQDTTGKPDVQTFIDAVKASYAEIERSDLWEMGALTWPQDGDKQPVLQYVGSFPELVEILRGVLPNSGLVHIRNNASSFKRQG